MYIYIVLTFSGANWENQATMGQETGRGISGGYECNFQTYFWHNSRIRNRVF